MQWLCKVPALPLYTRVLGAGHGQVGISGKKVSNVAYSPSVFIRETQSNTKHQLTTLQLNMKHNME